MPLYQASIPQYSLHLVLLLTAGIKFDLNLKLAGSLTQQSTTANSSMRFITPLLLLAVTVGVLAIPLDVGPSQNSVPDIPTISNFDYDFTPTEGTSDTTSSSRFSCGEYKFDDGWVQAFYSQVWAGRPRDQQICHPFNYEFTNPKKKNQPGKMIAAKVDLGCTCFFYS